MSDSYKEAQDCHTVKIVLHIMRGANLLRAGISVFTLQLISLTSYSIASKRNGWSKIITMLTRYQSMLNSTTLCLRVGALLKTRVS